MPPSAADDWKLVRDYPEPWELYDLAHDRSELDDLAARAASRRGPCARLAGLGRSGRRHRRGMSRWISMRRAASRRARRWDEMQSARFTEQQNIEEEIHRHAVKTRNGTAGGDSRRRGSRCDAARARPRTRRRQAVRGRRQAGTDDDADAGHAVAAGVHQPRRALRRADRQQGEARRQSVRRRARQGAQRRAQRRRHLRRVLLDTQWTIEMYEGGFVAPFRRSTQRSRCRRNC